MTTFADLVEATKKLDNARQIVVCAPGKGLQVETLIQRHDMSHLWEVWESPQCAEDQLYLVKRPPFLP